MLKDTSLLHSGELVPADVWRVLLTNPLGYTDHHGRLVEIFKAVGNFTPATAEESLKRTIEMFNTDLRCPDYHQPFHQSIPTLIYEFVDEQKSSQVKDFIFNPERHLSIVAEVFEFLLTDCQAPLLEKLMTRSLFNWILHDTGRTSDSLPFDEAVNSVYDLSAMADESELRRVLDFMVTDLLKFLLVVDWGKYFKAGGYAC